MVNPYFSYAIAFTISLMAYALGWSKLYPTLTISLFVFIAITIVLHLIFSIYWKNKIDRIYFPASPFLNPVITTIFIYILWTADFIYEGGIPLIKILTDQPYNYRLFGFPTLHVFTVTFGSFYTVYLFSLVVQQQKKIYLILYIVNLFAALLIYSRAMLIFNLSSSVFVYFLNSPRISWRRASFLILAPVLLIYLFGILGNLRVSFESRERYNSNTFLDIGQASDSFRNSRIPNEFFWGYIYLSSPLANLQQNINTYDVPSSSASLTFQHIYNEMSFDFISKRINRALEIEREAENNLPGTPFNVSTTYSRSFSYQSWAGMIMIALFILSVPIIYMKLLPPNRYQITGIATLNTIFLFLFYDNTIRFTGLGLQLLYPFLLPAFENAFTIVQKKIAV